jgi:hypothetical protein
MRFFLGLLRFIFFIQIGVRLQMCIHVGRPLSHDALHLLAARGYFATKCSAGRFFVEIFVYRILPFLRNLAIAGNLRVFAGNSRVFAGNSQVLAGSSRVIRGIFASFHGVCCPRTPRRFAGYSRVVGRKCAQHWVGLSIPLEQLVTHVRPHTLDVVRRQRH